MITALLRRLGRTGLLAALVVASTGAAACSLLDTRQPQAETVVGQAPQPSLGVFTPARRSFGEATREFFSIRPVPQQPIPFPHKTHIEKGLTCTDYCHESVTTAPVPGLPSVETCMICHEAIATDSPLIKQITALRDKGQDIPWQRVYGWPATAHVRFNHPPHLQAGIDCATCHGDVKDMTVAQRVVDHTMGFCVDCHRKTNAPNDCMTCHY